MRFDILTLFPEIFSGYLSQSLLNLAIERSLVQVNLHNIRDWSKDKHKSVDDRPYGGGPGMLLKVEPVVDCVEAVQKLADPGHLIMLSPTGRKLTQQVVEELATHPRLLAALRPLRRLRRSSAAIIKARRNLDWRLHPRRRRSPRHGLHRRRHPPRPGVLGDEQSARHDSFSDTAGHRLLESGHFTRPREYRGLTVPEVLLSGDHEEIDRWRKEQSLHLTRQRREDLLPPSAE